MLTVKRPHLESLLGRDKGYCICHKLTRKPQKNFINFHKLLILCIFHCNVFAYTIIYTLYTHYIYIIDNRKGREEKEGKKPHVFTAITQPLRVESMFLLLLNYNYSPREF